MNLSSDKISTNYFSVHANTYARETAGQIANKYWWIPLILILIPICYGMAVDWKWLIVSSAVIFIAIPTLLMFAWIFLLAQPGICEATFPTSILYDSTSSLLNVSYNPLQHGPNTDNATTNEQKTTNENHKSYTPMPFTCNVSDIISCDEWNQHIRLRFRQNISIRKILIPISSFNTPLDAMLFFTDINKKISPTPYHAN